MSEDSLFHVIDRCMATTAVLMEVLRQITFIQSSLVSRSPLVAAASAVVFLFGIYCFCQSSIAQKNMNRDAFVLWHFLWHKCPLVASVILLVDHKLAQQYEKDAPHSTMLFLRKRLKQLN